MGTRKVYEEQLRSGNQQHDPTISPGLGSARCPRCLSLINPNPEKGEWAIASVLHDATSVAGSGVGGLLGAVHSMNSGIPFVQKHVKGSKWLQFSVGVPSLLLYSGATSVLRGYLVPKFAQLTVASYYAASSASYFAISRFTNWDLSSASNEQIPLSISGTSNGGYFFLAALVLVLLITSFALYFAVTRTAAST